ncbi:MAG: Eco57I restriction-modification methylase domain-containing protein [Lachnospiraceae bacterium]|nr:Eco57I restriction-modification methylase domain-containing protein [Lachnospiraceae bacterium]
MLDHVVNQTMNFLENMPKSKRKKKGQFFTSVETARFMADMFDLDNCKGRISVLDPGAGTGILSVAFLERLMSLSSDINVSLTCYETDPEVLPVLKSNLEYAKSEYPDQIEYRVLEEDYILSQSNDFDENLLANEDPLKYDYVIANPPYLRVMRNHPAAMSMPKVVHGAPNLYFLFAAMSLFNLKKEAEMVYIIPRSWTSGAYFKAFREYLLTEGKIEQIHLFVSRDKVFNAEEVLQETMIIKVRRSNRKPEDVLITSSNSCNDFADITRLMVPYNAVVSGEDLYVYLPTSDEEIEVIKKINTYHTTLPDEGLKMKTGIVVDFRQWDELRKEPGDHILPLFYSQHIRDGRVNHQPSGKEYDWIIDEKPGLIQKNKNYVFIKRFTAKEERRRLQCGVYSPADFKEYKFIGTQNKINFVDRVDGSEMDAQTTYGVYALLNSTLFDMYYRILNGSTQVNSTEINNIPVPPANMIKKIGERVLVTADLSTDNCDRIITEVAYA